MQRKKMSSEKDKFQRDLLESVKQMRTGEFARVTVVDTGQNGGLSLSALQNDFVASRPRETSRTGIRIVRRRRHRQER